MGKKVKEDKKPPPDDVFDTLSVESRQAGTVVLMLSSPEEDVQSKACEAIYKFVDKCDENKKQLLDLGAGEALLKLMQSEDRIVRRNACMALGVMTANPDVRKFLRKREESIPAFIQLLAPEEDTVVHEFAGLGLSNMATEFSSKATIFESGGVDALVKCLGSSDPDVQKNSVEALAQLLLDYQSRAAIRDADGLNPLLELLKSEFAIIQKLSLLALDRASQDSENRSALRELEAMTKLVDFVAHPEWNDLHVMAVMVLSNLLEDLESLELVKETGGLKRLVALITDQVPPEEEPKAGTGKGEKKAGSRAAKKSAKGSKSGKKEESEKEEPPPGEAIIPTLPDVKMSAAKAIARSARSAENRKILHEQEAEKMLIHLLSHESTDVQTAAAQALGIMSENLLSKDSIREWEGMQPLIKLCNSDNGDVKEAVTLALANLTTGNSTNCQEVSNLNGVETLIHLLADPRDEAVANTCCVLTNMATEEALRTEAQGKGIVTALLEPLKSQNTRVQAKSSLAVAAYVCDADSRSEFRNAGGLESLIQLLHSGNDEVRRNAAWALAVCAVDEPTAVEICKLGGMDLLQEIQVSGTRKNPFAEVALERLLDANLSAKYALTGQLSSTNLIEDGFYDAGQIRPNTKFMSIEDYCKQELNDKRPVLFINAKADPVTTQSTSNPEMEAKENSKTNVSGKSSRTGREGKGGRRRASMIPDDVDRKSKQKEKEEKQKEEELQAQLQKEAEALANSENQPVNPPTDSNLVKYIEEVTERILPLATATDQVKALAQFVADKMGGPIEKGQLPNFSWELPLSQVKFELKSNVVPIGKIKAGIHVHRALLFKALADRIALPCSLTRGDYNRAWNEVMLPETQEQPGGQKFPPCCFLVDLIHQPGQLLKSDSPEAVTYKKL
ncbi:armadillo repeat-containing protein 3-like isoform X1 [Saccostrea cucullata]|uniref:armadillo repeat-containing protein 3-like isoform X1 n=1 Tax=Saccostrea cuccullata TaxID=36930 RepID=UPI002ED665A0